MMFFESSSKSRKSWNGRQIRQYVRYNGSTSTVTVMQCGVPQGSVLDPLYFVLYTADVFQIAGGLGFFIHGYADDLQIYDHCLASDTPQLTNRLAHCIEFVGCWMSSNRLRLNPPKTEFIWLGLTRRLASCTFDPITIGGEIIQPSLTVRDLGAYIASSIGFAEHVAWLVRMCYFHIRQLRSIRRSLTESLHALVRALVLTCLDYCNGLLGRTPKCLLSLLSGVLRGAAQLILLLPWTSSVADRIHIELHWLDIPSRVTFKLCVLAYRWPPWVCSGVPCPLLYASQCHRWMFTSLICSVGSVICTENEYLDNWPLSSRDIIPDGLELPLARSLWSRSQPSNI